MINNILVYFDIFIMPLCSTAQLFSFFQNETCPPFTRLSTVLPDASVYFEHSDPAWASLLEEVLTGKIPVCDYFTCPQDFEMDSLMEAFSFMDINIEQLVLLNKTGYAEVLRDPSQKAASILKKKLNGGLSGFGSRLLRFTLLALL
jgi:hypothetical protein